MPSAVRSPIRAPLIASYPRRPGAAFLCSGSCLTCFGSYELLMNLAQTSACVPGIEPDQASESGDVAVADPLLMRPPMSSLIASVMAQCHRSARFVPHCTVSQPRAQQIQLMARCERSVPLA